MGGEPVPSRNRKVHYGAVTNEPPRLHIVTVRDGLVVSQKLWEVTEPDSTLLLVSAAGRTDVRLRAGKTPPELEELN